MKTEETAIRKLSKSELSGLIFTEADVTFLRRKRLEAQVRCQSRRFLSFSECCKWVQINLDFKSADEWYEWVSLGEGLSPYIPTRPDEVYSRQGKWRGWDYFLQGIVNGHDDPGEDLYPHITC